MRTLYLILERATLVLLAGLLLAFALHLAGAVAVLYAKVNLGFFERL
jgi:hypothetical protein